MRIDNLRLENYPPLRHFEITTNSNVVIIAGANGSGKTRLKQALIETFSNPGGPRASMTLGATRPEEEKAWAGKILSVTAGQASPQLQTYMSRVTRGRSYVGTVIRIDSDRAVQAVNYQTWNLGTTDPDDDDVNYSYYLAPFIGRWQQLVNNIHRKAASRDNKIAALVKTGPPGTTFAEALAAHPDPFLPYQQVFAQLLPGKTLEPIDPKAPQEFRYRVDANANPMYFGALSSGEQEVVRVTFDLVWKEISHSVILVDEPELHLHPTLTFRLLETLKGLGQGTNQFILFTHSADLISTYYGSGNVFFIDASEHQDNQARQLSTLTDEHAATARAAGANLGLFAVGRKLVFVEGTHASTDRAIYHKVAQAVFPDAYLLPVGSVENLLALRSIVDELGKAVFGIDLFMVRDRDGLTDDTVALLEANPRMRVLQRRHIENYLLDEEVLGAVARSFYLPTELSDPRAIAVALGEAAKDCLMQAVLSNVKERVRLYGALSIPAVRDPSAQTLDELIDAILKQLEGSKRTLDGAFAEDQVRKLVRQEHARLKSSLENDTWRAVLPGKQILARFCGNFWRGVEMTRVREAYADIGMRVKPTVFADISALFTQFKELGA